MECNHDHGRERLSQTLFQVGVLAALLVLLVSLLLSGDIFFYLSPKMLLPMAMGIVIILGMIVSVFIGTAPARRFRIRDYLLALCVLLAFAIPPQSLERQMVETRGTQFKTASSSPDQSTASDIPGVQSESLIQAEPLVDTTIAPEKEPSVIVSDGASELEVMTILERDDFLTKLDPLYDEIENHIGQRVRISGFAYTLNELDDNQLVVGRLYIICCAADASIVGLLCQLDEDIDFEADAWYEAEGTIKMTQFQGEPMPLLKVSSWKSIESPENPFVY